MTHPLLSLVVAFIPLAAAPQPTDGAPLDRGVADVDEALSLLHSAYAGEPVAETLTIEVQRTDGPSGLLSAELRIASSPPTIRYDTRGLAFVADAHRLTAVRASQPDSRLVFVLEDADAAPAERLAAAISLPPLPQLWAPSNGSPPEITDPTIGAVRFVAAASDSGKITLSGVNAFGDVLLEIDARTGRLIRLVAPIREGIVETRAAPTNPGDPASWSIDTRGLRRVTRIEHLASRLPEFQTGQTLPDLALSTFEGTPTDLASWQESVPASAPRAPWSLAVFVDATAIGPGEALAEAAFAIDRIQRAALDRRVDAEPAERFWLRFRPLVVIVLDGVAPTMPRSDAWAADAGIEADILLSASPRDTIDRLPRARVVAVAVDAERTIGAVQQIDTTEGAAALIEQMLVPTRNAPE
ncbi:MAG: hypothetical protein AAFR96_07710 [Planctomycetota bacterium]